MHPKSILRAGLLSLSLGALLGNAVSASDETTIKLITDGEAEVLVLRDLDATLPVGETREFRTESGKTAIVGRSEDGLIVDIDGEQTEIRLLEPGAAVAGSEHDVAVWVEGDPGSEGAVRIEKRIAIAHAGDAAEAIAHAEAHGDGKRVIVLHGDGKGDIETALAAAGVDEATRQRVLVKVAAGEGETRNKEVIVTRRIRSDAD